MSKSTVAASAKWKATFVMMFNNTPKKHRKTIAQINNIKSLAKLHAALWI